MIDTNIPITINTGVNGSKKSFFFQIRINMYCFIKFSESQEDMDELCVGTDHGKWLIISNICCE